MTNKKIDLLESSLMTACVKKSMDILKMKATLPKLQECITSVTTCPVVFPHEGCLKALVTDIEQAITDRQLQISKLLSPILAPHGIYIDNVFWFSTYDIRKGYILFKRLVDENDTCVLFLRSFMEPMSDNFYDGGTVVRYHEVKELLKDLDEANKCMNNIPLQTLVKSWYTN